MSALQCTSVYMLALSAVGILIGHKFISVYQSIKSVNFLPGRVYFVDPGGVISNFFLPRISCFSAGRNFLFVNKYSEYEELGCSIYRTTYIWPVATSILVLADADAIKDVTSSRTRFPKPTELYGSLAFFGRNILVSEGEEWKKYRKISAPAFSERNNKLVWDETIKIMDALFTEVWANKDSITVDHCADVTLPLALAVISAAGFGKRVTWKDDGQCPSGHDLSFKEALRQVGSNVFLKLAVPDWATGLTERIRQVQKSFDELELYISEMLYERANGGNVQRSDLLSNLLESNSLDASSGKLTESDIVGNIFIFLLAGHETTANNLCFALAFLALYPNEQEKLYARIKPLLPEDGSPPVYEQKLKLSRYCLAVLYETMRLVPPVTNVPKYAAEDTTLMATNANGDKVVIPVPRGTMIGINTAGLHYSPRYWEDPHAFKPDRFLGEYNRDAFIPFSTGARSCIGRRFSETEGIAVLSMILSQYKITVKEEPQFAHETVDEKRARLLLSKPGLTVTPVQVPLVFIRRH